MENIISSVFGEFLKETGRLYTLAEEAEKLEKLIEATAPCELCKHFCATICGYDCIDNSDFIFDKTLINKDNTNVSKPKYSKLGHQERMVLEMSTMSCKTPSYMNNILD